MAPYPIDVCQVIPCDRCSVFPAVESSSVTGELCNKRGSWAKNPVACYAYIHCILATTWPQSALRNGNPKPSTRLVGSRRRKNMESKPERALPQAADPF
jgi:hypothetical protein